MTKPRYHYWLFLFALLCRLLAGEQAMADMSAAMPVADCDGHSLMSMHGEHPAVMRDVESEAPSSHLHEHQQAHGDEHQRGNEHTHGQHPLTDAAGDDTAASAHAACESHDCCPTGACDCACVHLTLLLPSATAAPLLTAADTLAASWLQPAPPQRPERVFRPPA